MCYGLNVCVLPKIDRWKLIPNVIVLESRASGRLLGHESSDLMNGIGAVIKEIPEK